MSVYGPLVYTLIYYNRTDWSVQPFGLGSACCGRTRVTNIVRDINPFLRPCIKKITTARKIPMKNLPFIVPKCSIS